MRYLRGNTWNARLFEEGTGSSPRAMRADRRRCCNMPATLMVPHRPVDDADSDRTLLSISARSPSFRIECIIALLSSFSYLLDRLLGARGRFKLPADLYGQDLVSAFLSFA